MEHDLFSFFLSGSLPTLAVVSAGWAAFNLRRRNPSIGLGALASCGVLSAAWAASFTNFWREGGWTMAIVAITGAYAVGSAVAARVAKREAPRLAAWLALVVTVILAGAARHGAMIDLEAATRNVSPEDARLILAVGSSEAWRPVQLSLLLGVVAAALLLRRGGGRGPTLGSGEAVGEEMRAEHRTRVERSSSLA